ncbi:MAG: serine/threonine-protein kinase [Myxococcaceae bacterium]|nr:serine/threonine-protein kinase [Myxococcaceae bacterium]
MADTIPLVGPNDTMVNPAAQAERPTVAEPITVPAEARRSTVLPRLEWNGPTPVASASTQLRFEELSPLGRGGMGEVVLAKDHDIERTVAIKRLTDQSDLGLVMRFVDEIRTVGALEHPNIVPVHDVGVDEAGRYFFVMKHLRGESLEAIIARLKAGDAAAHARFPFHVRVQVFLSILNAMAYAHEQGYVHRDLKPANVMIGPYGEVTVMDWGLARHLQKGAPTRTAAVHTRDGTALQTHAGAVMGTPFYMSPEQARGDHDALDQRSDIYSLAVLFHEFLYLTHYLDPLEAVPEVIDGVQKRTPAVFDVRQSPHQPAVPAELGWFLLKAMEKDPAQRFQTTREMIDALQRIIDGRVVVQCQRTFTKRMLQEAIHRVDAHPVAIIVGSTLVLALVVAGLVNTLLSLF